MTLVNLRKTVEHYRQKLDSIESPNTERFQVLQGLPFYYWDKPKEQQRGTFVGTSWSANKERHYTRPL